MFKVRAASLEEYFRSDPAREDALRELDAVIRAAAPALSRWFVPGTPPGQPGTTMTMIGCGQYWYTVFTNIDDINLQALAEMVTAIAAGLESGQLVAR
jgi:hypothetical protein